MIEENNLKCLTAVTILLYKSWNDNKHVPETLMCSEVIEVISS